MAKAIYHVTAPDGTPLSREAGSDETHTIAVLGLLRLRKPLPKINPDDPSEETRYNRFKSWVLIGTAADQKAAEILASCQGYRNVTEETRFLPVTVEHVASDRPAPTWLHKAAPHEVDV